MGDLQKQWLQGDQTVAECRTAMNAVAGLS